MAATVDDLVELVNDRDEVVGSMEKLRAHRTGALHRAFSVFIFNTKGQLLIQRRAASKYHGGGLWTNTCCSHPRPGEDIAAAARRRLLEEMGFACPLQHRFSFTYRAEMGNGLIEHEVDHVFFGEHDHPVKPDPNEVDQVRWVGLDELERQMVADPASFTPWLGICWAEVLAHRQQMLRET